MSIKTTQANTSDEMLVAAALTGSPEDFSPIIARYKDAIFGVSIARLRDFDNAEDITQQVFIEAFERLASLKDPKRLGAWLRTIAIHRSLKYRQREQRRAELNTAALPVGQVPTPAEELERRELRDQVLAAIGRLSKVQRETVALYYISGYSQQEVAAIQEVPLGTIKHRLYQARHKLKKDMVEMVEEVLKEGAPKEDFAQKVFNLLCAYPKKVPLWNQEVMEQIEEAGSSSEAGFVRALELPHWQTRRAAVAYLGMQSFRRGGVLPLEKTVELLKKALVDSNRKVRNAAIYTLLWDLGIDGARRNEQYSPLLVPLLCDHSVAIRRRVARLLSHPTRVRAVPLQTATRALAQEQDIETLRYLQQMVQNLLEQEQEQPA